MLWGIWFARNKKVWEGKILSSAVAMEISTKVVGEWQEVNKRKAMLNNMLTKPPDNNIIQWIPPPAGCFKIYVDASVYVSDTSFALGMVLRDDNGKFIEGKNMRVGGKLSVTEAEARGVQEALIWIEELGLQHVTVESDSELVVHALQRDIVYLVEVGHTIEVCKEKLGQRTDIAVVHVKKQANRVAHLLARIPCLLNSFNHFVSPPNVLLEMLSSEFPS